MKRLLFLSLLCHPAYSQSFKIGTLDVFGNRHVSADSVLGHFPYKIGDSIHLDKSKPGDLVMGLKKIPGISDATINVVCCDTANNLMLFIGIGETGSMPYRYRVAPTGDIRLTDTMMKTNQDLAQQIEKAAETGQISEEDSNGYALTKFPPAMQDQKKYLVFARESFGLLSDVLHHSKYAEHRAAATQIIAYASDRKAVAANLAYAADDSDDEVRNNATRALGVLWVWVNEHPESNIHLDAEPFIRMLNSIIWTDRNKAGLLLSHLTEHRDTALLGKIRNGALPSLIEMASWPDRGHASPYFIILGRMAGVDDKKLLEENYSKEWKTALMGFIGK